MRKRKENIDEKTAIVEPLCYLLLLLRALISLPLNTLSAILRLHSNYIGYFGSSRPTPLLRSDVFAPM